MRASAALFSHLSTFCKGGICEGRCEAPRGPPMRSAGVRWCVVVLPMLGARHTKLPPKEVRVRAAPLHLFQILEGGIREAERGARAGPVRSVGGRGCGGRRSPPFARDSARPRAPERLVCEGVGCGAGCGTRCGAPAPRGRARGRAARSWPRRRWLSIREEVGTRILRNLGSDGLEVMFVSIWVTVLTHTAYSCFRLSSSRAKHCSQLVVPFRFDLRNLTSSGPRVGTSGGGTSSSEGRFLSAVASLACLSDI